MMHLRAEAMRLLGPSPLGDPASMRAHAVTLTQLAQGLETQAAAVAHAAPSGDGGLVHRSQQQCELERRRLVAAAAKLHDFAARLRHDAGSVEHAQHGWAEQLRRLEHELVERARHLGR